MLLLLVLLACGNFRFEPLDKGVLESLELCITSQDRAAFEAKIGQKGKRFFVENGERLLKFAFHEEDRKGIDLSFFVERLLFSSANPFMRAPEKYNELFEFSKRRIMILESFNDEGKTILSEREFESLLDYAYKDISVFESILQGEADKLVELAGRFNLPQRDVMVGNKSFYLLLAEKGRIDILEILLGVKELDHRMLFTKNNEWEVPLYIFAKKGFLPEIIRGFSRNRIPKNELLITLYLEEKMCQYSDIIAPLLWEELDFCVNLEFGRLCAAISEDQKSKGKLWKVERFIQPPLGGEVTDDTLRRLRFVFEHFVNLEDEEEFILSLLDARTSNGYVLELVLHKIGIAARERLLAYDRNFLRAAFEKLEDENRLRRILDLASFERVVEASGRTIQARTSFNFPKEICRISGSEEAGKDMITEVLSSGNVKAKMLLILAEELPLRRLEKLLEELRKLEDDGKPFEGLEEVRQKALVKQVNKNAGGKE